LKPAVESKKLLKTSENQRLKAKTFFKKNYISFVKNVTEKVRFSGWTNCKFKKSWGVRVLLLMKWDINPKKAGGSESMYSLYNLRE